MPIKGLNARLTALEGCYKRDRLVVLAWLPDGTQRPMTVDEMIELNGGFCKVLSGNDLEDLDTILNLIEAKAFEKQ